MTFARFLRLEMTPTFRDAGLGRWRSSRVAIVGCGNIGSRLASEVVRSGARVLLIDPDSGRDENLGTQAIVPGAYKVDAVADAADAIAPGRAETRVADVRQLGVGAFAGCDAIFDCTDDASLALLLTRLSNGLGIPLLRVALDGTGVRELGRLLVSHGGGGHACQICAYSPADLHKGVERTPCPGSKRRSGGDDGVDRSFRPPTVAGGALGMAVAGIGLLAAQRIVTGNDADRALDHELIIDLSDNALIPLRLKRSEACLADHRRWSLVDTGLSARDAGFEDLFAVAAEHLDGPDVVLEPFGQSLAVGTNCACGRRTAAVGFALSAPPVCAHCGRATCWSEDAVLSRVRAVQTRALGIHHLPLARLGLPTDGALVLARRADRPDPQPLLLDSTS